MATRKEIARMIFLGACLADIAACSSAKPLEEYAIEHDLLGNRICNADLPEVDEEQALTRGCVSGAASIDKKEESNVKEEETSESTLF